MHTPDNNNKSFEAIPGEICGLTIKNVSKEENGFIRLTSANNKNEMARGIVFIDVQSIFYFVSSIARAPLLRYKQAIDWFLFFQGDFSKPIEKHIQSIAENISPEKTTYCYVLRPDETKTTFPQHENCGFPALSRESEMNGIWQIVSGIKGKTEEVSFQVNVQPIGKRLIINVKWNDGDGTKRKKKKRKQTII